jgi:hypothetical protein
MNWIISILSWLADNFYEGLRVIIQTTVSFATSGWTWLVVTVVGFIAITDKVSTFVYNSVVAAASALSGVSTNSNPSASSGAASLFDHVNAIFPLQESFTLLSAWSLLMLSAMTYRLVKSWIPSLS